jgi:threonine/homoserine/homoserine lactone efflux protein
VTTTQALLSFAMVAALLTIIPGMDTAMVLRSAISQNRRHAYATALGINSGAMIWGIAAAVGASALLAASEAAFTALKLVGAAYMVWLGASLLWKSFRAPAVPAPATGTFPVPRGGSLLASWAKGTGTNLLNPKVGVFYIAMIPQFIPDEAAPLLMGIALAAVHNLLGLLWFTGIIFGTHVARKWLRTPKVAKTTDRLTGTVMIGFGTALALETR